MRRDLRCKDPARQCLFMLFIKAALFIRQCWNCRRRIKNLKFIIFPSLLRRFITSRNKHDDQIFNSKLLLSQSPKNSRDGHGTIKSLFHEWKSESESWDLRKQQTRFTFKIKLKVFCCVLFLFGEAATCEWINMLLGIDVDKFARRYLDT